ncbi:MAG TPA: hypothetical protein VIL30_05345 [Ramlibacter sp.]
MIQRSPDWKGPPWRPFFTSLLLALPALAQAQAQAADWELRLRSSRHSDFGSLSDLHSDDITRFGTRSGRNIAYIDDEARVQRRDGPWSLALVARSTATLTSNRDAIAAARHAQGLDRDAADQRWSVDARLRGFNGVGGEVGYEASLAPEWKGMVLAQALALTRWRDRRISGTASFDAATTTYDFDLASDEVNDRLRLLPFQARESFSPRGAALLFGFGATWSSGDFTVTAAARDLGWLHWNGIPRQDLSLASNTQGVDAQGFVVYRPLLQGANRQSRFTRTAQPRVHVSGRWQVRPDRAAGLGVDYMPDLGLLPYVSWQQQWGTLHGEATWHLHERRATLAARWANLRVELGTDRLGGDAASRTIGLSYVLPL